VGKQQQATPPQADEEVTGSHRSDDVRHSLEPVTRWSQLAVTALRQRFWSEFVLNPYYDTVLTAERSWENHIKLQIQHHCQN
jgi:hypothetical protein